MHLSFFRDDFSDSRLEEIRLEGCVSKNSGIEVMDQLKRLKERMDVLYSQSLKFDNGSQNVEYEAEAPEQWRPSVDILESDNEFIIVADLPGVLEEDLKVELREKVLTISGKRKRDLRQANFASSHNERPVGHFERSFPLPESSKGETILAELSRGVLRISVAKHV